MTALAISFMNLDDASLKMLSADGSDEERKYADRITPLLANKHLLLCTFLLGMRHRWDGIEWRG